VPIAQDQILLIAYSYRERGEHLVVQLVAAFFVLHLFAVSMSPYFMLKTYAFRSQSFTCAAVYGRSPTPIDEQQFSHSEMRQPYRIFRTWGWETLSIALAIGLLAAISALLVSYDGKPAPDWGTHLNFNALLALLSTILRAMLVVIVSQIICQQKWVWYSNKDARPLSDLQQFDSGSRGSLGALLLIPKVVLKDPVTLIAAAVLVVSFLVGPFVQQASRTMPCTFPAPDQKASLPYAQYVPRRLVYSRASAKNLAGPKPELTVAILSSIAAPGGVENQISASCSTGNCTFRDSDRGEDRPKSSVDDSRSTHSTVGMCDKCIDISHLASHQSYLTRINESRTGFILPNGFNVSAGSDSLLPANNTLIGPTPDLLWLGELLTPELRTMSRWAYINATFLSTFNSFERNKTVAVAATCVLYPCVRTYTASITNNELKEKEIFSEPMEVELGSAYPEYIDLMPWYNGAKNRWFNYATVERRCQSNGQTYDTNHTTTTNRNTTELSLYDFTVPRQVTYRNISAPDSCIYRHDGQLVMAISYVLSGDLFNGICVSDRGTFCGSAFSGSRGALGDLGAKMVLEKLTAGERGFSNVTALFSSFANAMTNRLRFEFGGTNYNTSRLSTNEDLPMGEVQGLAWRTETCVSAHRDWLALPICLTTITTFLMIWTIANNWRERRTRPVWKDSLLPLLFYRHNIVSKESVTLPWWRYNHESEHNDTTPGTRNHFMEASEMNKISRRTPVTFHWPDRAKLDSSIESAGSSAIALYETGRQSNQRRSRDVDADSMLETIDIQDYRPSSVDTDHS
jgi:hypothetical protein